MDKARRLQLIHRYTDATDAIGVAMSHLSEADLDLRPSPKARSAREAIHHLADAELQESLSLRRMLAENRPVLLDWDSDRYRERLHYDRPVAASLEAFQGLARANVELLSIIGDDQWRREGKQQRPWNQTVENWLEEKVSHLHDQLMQILNAPTGGQAIPDP